MIDPIAAVVAGADPDIAAKMQAETTVTCPMPPGRCRTSTSATLISRCDRPPADMISPASMKNGIASRLKDWVPAIRFCASSTGSMPATSSTLAAVSRALWQTARRRTSSSANPADRIQAGQTISSPCVLSSGIRPSIRASTRTARSIRRRPAGRVQQFDRTAHRGRGAAMGIGEIAPARPGEEAARRRRRKVYPALSQAAHAGGSAGSASDMRT